MRTHGPPTRSSRARAQRTGDARQRRHLAGSGYARGEHTRQRVLEAGIELFAELGYERAATRVIARRAGVSLPALQYYFGGKEGLYRACAEYITADVRSRLGPAAERVRLALGRQDLTRTELLELLRAVVEPFLEGLATERPESWALFFARVQGEHGAAFEAIFQQIGGRLLALVIEIVSRILGRPVGSPKMSAVSCTAAGDCAPPPEIRSSRRGVFARAAARSPPSRSAKARPSRIAR